MSDCFFFRALEGFFFILEKQFRLGPKRFRLSETSPAETSPSETQFPRGDFWTGPPQQVKGDAEMLKKLKEWKKTRP